MRLSNSIFCLTVSLFLIVSCDSMQKSSWLEEASTFCGTHELSNWKDIAEDISVQEFNKLAIDRLKSNLKTDEFRKIADEIQDIEFYHNIYPDTQSKIETITGEAWHCEAFEKFYSLSISTTNNSLEPSAISKTVNILYSNSRYTIDESFLDLSSEKDTKEKIIGNQDPDKIQVLITVDGEVNIDSMKPLFDVLAGFGVQKISLIEQQ